MAATMLSAATRRGFPPHVVTDGGLGPSRQKQAWLRCSWTYSKSPRQRHSRLKETDRINRIPSTSSLSYTSPHSESKKKFHLSSKMGGGSRDLNIKIAELSRKLRQLEATKSHDDSRRSTKKARAKQLKKLQQINEKARWNLFLSTETSKKISNVSNIESMASLHAKCNMYLKRIQAQQQLMRDL